MAFLGPALSIAATVAGPLMKGIAGKKAGDTNAKRLREAKRDEELSGLGDRNRLREQVRGAIGEQLAAQVSNGLEGGSGTALDALRQSQIEGALDALELRRQTTMKATALEQQAQDAKRAGNMALMEGIIGAGSSLFKMKSDWAQEKRAGG